MIKLLLAFVLLLSLLACGKNDDSPSSLESGTRPVVNYSLEGLSDKLIVKNEQTHAPMDFISQELTMSFNPVSQKVTGESRVTFKLKIGGRPYFELKATPKNIRLNSSAITVQSINDPDGQNQSYWSLNQELPPGSLHIVEFQYELPSGRVSFTDGGVRFLTDMTDLSGKFFEYWGPTGFEEDTFKMDMVLKVENSDSNHVLRTNGTITSSDSEVWNVSFPDYYSKSSFDIHLTNQTTLPGKKFVYQGIEKEISVEVYGISTTLVNSAVAELPKLFKEFENDYGAYPHDKFLAYMNDRSGGMEYVAATITSLASLDHELLHSWFARSVIPADGRSGWIDEAMASWRDYGYTRAKTTLQRTPTNLANYSPFRKTTPKNSYVDGRGLFAELDLKFVPLGGLKPVMKAFFDNYKNSVVNNEEFWKFLESYSNMDLEDFKLRYTMAEAEEAENARPVEVTPSRHPTPLTREEILRLR
ncbi:MAG: hypothetical protein ACLGHN_11625 [Bacteriovoracia bacterium]